MGLTTLALKIHEPYREMFIRNHVRILLEKQIIFSLRYYENIFKNQQTRLPFMDCKCHPTQEIFKKSSVLYVY